MKLTSPGWNTLSLEQIAQGGLFSDGDWVESKDQDPAGGVRLTQLADIGVAVFRDRSDRWLREDQAATLGCTFIEPGDVLIARMPDPIGRACTAPAGIGRAVTAVDVAVLRVRRDDVDPRFVMWAINGPDFHDRVVSLQSGTTRKRISRRNLAALTLPVPSIGEQRHIVEILEDHLSRLDAADGYLASVRRRSASLVRSIVARATSIGKLVPLSSLSISAGYGTSTKCVRGGLGAPVVRIPNLIDGKIDLRDEKRVADPNVDVSNTMLRSGDLLIVRTNGSRDLIGRSAVVQEGIEAAYASYLIRYRLDTSRVLPEWVRLILDSPRLRSEIAALAASSAGQYNLSLAKLDKLPILLPSLDEQRIAVSRASGAIADLHRLDQEIAVANQQSDRLRRTLLHAAFSGRLTAPASNDETVEELA